MSYYIAFFPDDAATDEGFLPWFVAQTQWTEDHGYDDPAVSTPGLQAVYRALIAKYPPLNGPDAPTDEQIEGDEELEDRLTDYSIGTQILYASFAWSQASEAAVFAQAVAASCGVAVALIEDPPRIIHS